MIKTIICDINDILKDNNIENLYCELSFDIKNKIDSIKSIEKKKIDIVSFAMLYRLYDDINVKKIPIAYNQYGKPFFKSLKNNFFNISHSKDKIFIAISDKEIGVDVEYKKNDVSLCMKIAKRFYSDYEYELMKERFDKNEKDCVDLFYRLWTIRESFVKYLGTGLIYEKNDIVISFDDNDKPYLKYFKDEKLYQNPCIFEELDNRDNYKYCICKTKL